MLKWEISLEISHFCCNFAHRNQDIVLRCKKQLKYMATARISYIIEDCKRKASVLKWIENQKETARKLAFEHRNEINKRELEEDVKKLDCVLPLWELFKKLRKKSEKYDCLIDTDRKGYISIQIVFPITQSVLNKAYKNKKKWIEEQGNRYSQCIRMHEEVWKVYHEKLNKIFKGFQLRDNESYPKYGFEPLLRWVDVVGMC